jgi:hypothetical protein
LGLPFALWTREAVGLLIERESGVALSRSTISTYLHSWHLTPQRPRKRATERQGSKLRYWMKRRYPAISCARTCAAYRKGQPRFAPSSRLQKSATPRNAEWYAFARQVSKIPSPTLHS